MRRTRLQVRERQREALLRLLADGRIIRRIDLANGTLGERFSQGVIARMIETGELERAGSAGVRLRGWDSANEESHLAAVAKLFGPKGGVLTCHGALRLFRFGLTDESEANTELAVILPANAHRGSGNLNVRVVRSRKPEALTLGVEEREFLGYRMRVATPARALCDMFAAWAKTAGLVAEGAELTALVRISALANAAKIVNDAQKYAGILGWGKSISDTYNTVAEARKYDLEGLGRRSP